MIGSFDPTQHWFMGHDSYPDNIDGNTWLYRYPNFMPAEIASGPDKRQLLVYRPAMDGLQRIRTKIVKMHPEVKGLRINSSYRTGDHNRNVGGSPRSQHLLGRAHDISIEFGLGFRKAQAIADDIEDLAVEYGAKGFGRYDRFIHIDWRDLPDERTAYWDLRSRR